MASANTGNLTVPEVPNTATCLLSVKHQAGGAPRRHQLPRTTRVLVRPAQLSLRSAQLRFAVAVLVSTVAARVANTYHLSSVKRTFFSDLLKQVSTESDQTARSPNFDRAPPFGAYQTRRST